MADLSVWSRKTADTIIRQADPDGYHPELRKRWAYVPGMMQMAIARTGEYYRIPEYTDFMKKHMDLFVHAAWLSGAAFPRKGDKWVRRHPEAVRG